MNRKFLFLLALLWCGALQAATITTPFQGGTGVQNDNTNTLTWSGNHPVTLTTTGTTGLTLPVSGTLYPVGGALGTPSSGTATNLTGLPISTGVSGLGTGIAAFLATPTSANLATAVTNETGSGALVFGTSPVLTTPNLGTPSALTLTSATGLPISTGVSGLGTGIATALAVNTGSAGAPVLFNGALGTPSSGTVTNLTGTASININGTVGATTPAAGTFTSVTDSALTSGRATFATTGGALTDSANWLFDSASNRATAGSGSTTTAGIVIGNLSSALGAVSSTAAGMSSTTYMLAGNSTTTFLNAPSSAITFSIANGAKASLSGTAGQGFSVTAGTVGAGTAYVADFAQTLNNAAALGGIRAVFTDTLSGAWNALSLLGGSAGSTNILTVNKTGTATFGASGNGQTTIGPGVVSILNSAGTGSDIQLSPNNGGLAIVGSAGGFVFSQNATISGTFTAGLFQTAVATVACGNGTAGNATCTFNAATLNASSTIKAGGFTVSTLPTAGTAGRQAYVTDQLTTCAVTGAVLTGGGALVCPVFDNGVAWVGG